MSHSWSSNHFHFDAIQFIWIFNCWAFGVISNKCQIWDQYNSCQDFSSQNDSLSFHITFFDIFGGSRFTFICDRMFVPNVIFLMKMSSHYSISFITIIFSKSSPSTYTQQTVINGLLLYSKFCYIDLYHCHNCIIMLRGCSFMGHLEIWIFQHYF